MDKFSRLFYLYSEGKYDYLRIKNVDVNTEARTANVYVYVREDKYEHFDNSVIHVLRAFFRDAVPNYKFSFNFERLLVSADIVHRHLIEFVSVNFPFIAANIVFDTVDVEIVGDVIQITFYMPTRILDYAKERGFAEAIEGEMADAFIMQAKVDVQLTDTVVEENEADEGNRMITSVPVIDIHYLCGVRSDYSRMPTMISYVRQPAERTAICGNVGDMKCKEYEERPVAEGEQKRRFYKYHYTFNLNDGTEEMRVLFNTNDEKCPLKDIASGQLMVRGRVFYNERTQSMNMFAKTVYRCRINQEQLEQALKPLPVPEFYRKEPVPVVVSETTQMRMGFIEEERPQKHLVGQHVFLYFRVVPAKDALLPYELCAIRTDNGKPTLRYHSYVYLADVLQVDVSLKSLVTSAPRMAEIVPDLVKFFDGATVVSLNMDKVQGMLVEMAKALRYVFGCEWWDATQLTKKGKEQFTFAKACRNHQVAIASESAEDMAKALLDLYLCEKGVG